MSIKARLGALCVAALAMALALSACGSGSSSGGQSKTYKVLAILPTTGPAAAATKTSLIGLQAAAANLNAGGGVLGRHVELTIKNDEGDPAHAITELQSVLSSGTHPDEVIAGANSTVTAALAPLLTSSRLLSVGITAPGAAYDVHKYPYNFTIAQDTASYAAAVAAYARDHGAKKVGILAQNDVFGMSRQQPLAKALDDLGVAHVEAPFPPDALDLTPQLSKLQAAGADYVVAIAFGSPAVYALKARGQLGWDVPVLGDVSVGYIPLKTLVKPALLQGVTLTVYPVQAYVPPAQQTSAYRAFYRAVTASGPMTQLNITYALTYDAVEMAALGAEQAGTTDAAAVSRALEHFKPVSDPPFVTYPSYQLGVATHAQMSGADTWKFVPATSSVVDGAYKP